MTASLETITTFAITFDRFLIEARKHPDDAVHFRAVGVRERGQSSRDPNSTLRDQLPAWVDACIKRRSKWSWWQTVGIPRSNGATERRARDVAARLDDVADALRRAQLAEDDDERHDHIFAAHTALVRAETAFKGRSQINGHGISSLR
jgi:hypothetical protein